LSPSTLSTLEVARRVLRSYVGIVPELEAARSIIRSYVGTVPT
jgi:hypothetical protein